jgi:hypothetical protein
MGTEIYRVRPVADGRIRFEVECDDIAHFSRVANMIMGVVPAASAPVEPTAWSYYAEAQARLRFAAEREAKREAAQQATGRRIPVAHMPPYDTTLGGQPLPGGYMMADVEEPPLRAFTADEAKVGGTD